MGTKQKILDCSILLFSERGFNGVSIREIARAVGIKESSIYNHYTGKQAIIEEICASFTQSLSFAQPPLIQIEEMLSHQKPREIFQSFILSYGGNIQPRLTQMAKIVFSEQFHQGIVRNIFLEKFVEDTADYYQKVLSLMQKKGLICPCDTFLLAHIFNNQQISLSMQLAQCQTEAAKKAIVCRMLESAEFLIGTVEIEPTHAER